MKLKMTLSALAATSMIVSAPIAQAAVGYGALGASETENSQRSNRQNRRARHQTQSMTNCQPGMAQTSTTGSSRTTRRSAESNVDTRARASGSGSVSASSEGDSYASTTRNRSEADSYGNSTATAQEPTRRRC